MATKKEVGEFNLIGEVQEVLNDSNIFGDYNEPIMTSTGLDCLDYLNGQVRNEPNPDGSKHYDLGIDMGKHTMIVGKSGSGKSTLAYQIAANIITRYKQGQLIVMDFENAFSPKRFMDVTGVPEDYFHNGKVVVKNNKIFTETVYELIYQLQKLKDEHAKSILIDNLEEDYGDDGTLRKIFPPTIILIDSFSLMQPRSISLIENAEMKGQMSATQSVKAATQLMRSIQQSCGAYNITLIFINHVLDKVETNPAMPTQASINYLGQTESIPGGKVVQFLQNTLIKVSTKSKLEEDKLFRIKGFEASIKLIKSRTAPAGSEITLIYNQREGFDNELSIFQYLKDNNLIKGAGVGMYLEGLEDVKFRMSNIKETLASNPEFKKRFFELAHASLSTLVRESSRRKFDEVAAAEPEVDPEKSDTSDPEN